MKTTVNRTIEDRLEDMEKELPQVKMMCIQLLSRHTKETIENENMFMNVKDVARFLKVETAVVYAACSKGELPFYYTLFLQELTSPYLSPLISSNCSFKSLEGNFKEQLENIAIALKKVETLYEWGKRNR